MKRIVSLMLLSLALCGIVNPDALLDMEQILKKHNYKSVKYSIETEDGYILETFRIFPRNKTKHYHNGQPVYLQHGVFCSSEAFISGGLNRSIVYLLADNGYDVWVPNSRGGMYSRKHTKYTTKDPEYWNFTFEEQGLYDQRAVINFIIKETGFQKVHFWSHSMGGTQMMAALTLDPDFYRKHLLSAILTGPVFRFDTTQSPFIKIMNYTKIPYWLYDLGVYEFLPYVRSFSIPLIYLKAFLNPIFVIVFKFITDERVDIDDVYNIDIFASHFPAGTSTKCFKHLIQLTEHTGFFRYRERVMDKPIPYDLSKIPDEIPLAIYAGEYDMLGTASSIIWFQQQMLKHHKQIFVKTYKDVGHATFVSPLETNDQFLRDGLRFFENAESVRK